ncbi:MAG: HAMP domain-containing histidine kinase [Elusimicrobiota bacterium]|nr:MAG: HAMP domain-containing histidine kinase [Elusimicrobiota bacterium]
MTAERDGAGVRFAVRDTGDGIAPEEVGKLFQSFYQGESASGGGRLGLGLSISREIVDSHGGRIWVESAGVGKGAAFLFMVPAAPPRPRLDGSVNSPHNCRVNFC